MAKEYATTAPTWVPDVAGGGGHEIKVDDIEHPTNHQYRRRCGPRPTLRRGANVPMCNAR